MNKFKLLLVLFVAETQAQSVALYTDVSKSATIFDENDTLYFNFIENNWEKRQSATLGKDDMGEDIFIYDILSTKIEIREDSFFYYAEWIDATKKNTIQHGRFNKQGLPDGCFILLDQLPPYNTKSVYMYKNGIKEGPAFDVGDEDWDWSARFYTNYNNKKNGYIFEVDSIYLKRKYYVKNDLLFGEFEMYYSNNKGASSKKLQDWDTPIASLRCNFLEGKIEGLVFAYHENGKIGRITKYKNDVPKIAWLYSEQGIFRKVIKMDGIRK